MGVAKQPPRSLSVHAQCFWPFTATERFIMGKALNILIKTQETFPENRSEREYRVTRMLRDALMELSTQD